ncbi:MAG: hypothetical protein AUK03_15565 [Anaerolineae bacterium CG2_30_64_16]|nr:MAG: hypothetical protein AUK03_15565 [Anaerolineae bacterium CG2_30_64_16]
MWIEDLIWDEYNTEHIAWHQVERREVEEAVWGDVWFKKGPGKKRYYAYSQTREGRYLFVVLDREYDNYFYVVTTRDMDDSDKRLYRRGRRR